ncbi:MAG: hypothetical protein EWM47_06190 [Anaerolineaceae bacterium]|nr:MAG: hypothetical protein EWM47_06190 [Anaerolineaceae bacterium]
MKHRIEEINKLQIPTWSRHAINETTISLDFTDLKPYRENPLKNNDNCIQIEENAIKNSSSIRMEENALKNDADTNVKGVREFVRNHSNQTYHIHINDNEVLDEPMVLNFIMDSENSLLIEEIIINAGRDSKATIIISYFSKEDGRHIHCGHTKMNLDKGAEIDLIKIQLLSEQSTHLDKNRVTVGEGAVANMILAELGSGNLISECDVSLESDRSMAKLDSIYIGNKSKVIDMNYRMEYVGRHSQGFITAKGALMDKCRKTFKNTLDFVAGSFGSKGREEETVISLSEEAVNISVPLLLCGEENVEGQHASNIGRLSKSKLFYLMSRGLNEKEAKRLMVEASFTPIIEKIPLEALRNRIFHYISEVIQHDK